MLACGVTPGARFLAARAGSTEPRFRAAGSRSRSVDSQHPLAARQLTITIPEPPSAPRSTLGCRLGYISCLRLFCARSLVVDIHLYKIVELICVVLPLRHHTTHPPPPCPSSTPRPRSPRTRTARTCSSLSTTTSTTSPVCLPDAADAPPQSQSGAPANRRNPTGFLDDHPGGAKILKRVAGKDASKQFWKYHSKGVLAKYGPGLQVGTVKDAAKL